jgi:hypothetical protein
LKNDIEDFPDNQESWEIRQLDGFIPRLSVDTGKEITAVELIAIKQTLGQEISTYGPPLADKENLDYERVKSFLTSYRKGE